MALLFSALFANAFVALLIFQVARHQPQFFHKLFGKHITIAVVSFFLLPSAFLLILSLDHSTLLFEND
jgi:hypothetical protein